MPLPGPFELIIILVIILLVFGVGKLPEVGGALGRGIREFKKASEIDSTKSDTANKPAIDAPQATITEHTTVDRTTEERPASRV